jgi:hypothetical protein
VRADGWPESNQLPVTSFETGQSGAAKSKALTTDLLITGYFRATPNSAFTVRSRGFEHEIEIGNAALVGVANI